MENHYQNQTRAELAALLDGDAITYSVLRQILTGTCADIVTDGANWIVCHSAAPYPVWVWCRDAENGDAVRRIARCLKEQFPLESDFVVILGYELRQKLAAEDAYFATAREKMGLLSYRLDVLSPAPPRCEGRMRLVAAEELEDLIPHWIAMRIEMEGRRITPEKAMETMTRLAGENRLYAWCDGAEQVVALCARIDQAPYSKITSVYTLPQHRRKGYCQNLIHSVTQQMLSEGFTPILYTDAAYAASNACYQKIGYHQIGRLTSMEQ